jgi:hypothetical protein
MRLPIKTFSSSLFTWHGGVGYAEISDLKGVVADSVMCRVFDDAIDVGFNVLSEKTGDTKLFTLVKADRDDDGDVTAFRLESEDGIKITIFND